MNDWDSYEKDVRRGPGAAIRALFVVVILLMIAGTGIGVFGYFLGWFSEAAKVAQKEFGAEEALRKYEWFKDAAAQLDKKRADIAVYDERLARIEAAYAGQLRVKWARDDREQHSIWSGELAGVRASYNGLAAEYNANMAKFNWRFANAGQLPPGATEPLPREFKPYEEGGK